MRRVARGNRIGSINKVIFPIFIFYIIKMTHNISFVNE